MIITQIGNQIKDFPVVRTGRESFLAVNDDDLVPGGSLPACGASGSQQFNTSLAGAFLDDPLFMFLDDGQEINDKRTVRSGGVNLRRIEDDDLDVLIGKNLDAGGTVGQTAERPIVHRDNHEIARMQTGQENVARLPLKPRRIGTDGAVLVPTAPFDGIVESPCVLLNLEPRLAGPLLSVDRDDLFLRRRSAVPEHVVHHPSPGKARFSSSTQRMNSEAETPSYFARLLHHFHTPVSRYTFLRTIVGLCRNCFIMLPLVCGFTRKYTHLSRKIK